MVDGKTREMFAIGVDVGATWTRAAIVGESQTLIASRKARTCSQIDGESFLQSVKNCLLSLLEEGGVSRQSITGIGIAVPGTVDGKKSVVVRSVNLPWIEGLRVSSALEERSGFRVSMCSDAEAATWGELTAFTLAAARFVHLRLGSGVACGVILDGQWQPTDGSRTTHWDLLVINSSESALPCPCGLRGCLEIVASGLAIERRLSRAGIPKGLPGLERACRANEAAAIEILNDVSSAVARAIANIVDRYRPDMICLGGGVVEHWPILFDEAVRQCGVRGLHVVLQRSRLGDDAGVVGAAMRARCLNLE